MSGREGGRRGPRPGGGRVLCTCTGCGETWEAPASLVGQRCGDGTIRLASGLERARWERSCLL